jgi:hypothetical protein
VSDIVIPEEAVEDAAKAACEYMYPPSRTGRAKAHDSWDEIEDWERGAWLGTADAAVAAALPALRRQWAEEAAQAIEGERRNPARGWNSPAFGDLNAQMYHDAMEMCERIVHEYGETHD